MNKKIDYLIKCIDKKCTLVSIVETDFGGPAENFICEGTIEYCRKIQKQLEGGSKNG